MRLSKWKKVLAEECDSLKVNVNIYVLFSGKEVQENKDNWQFHPKAMEVVNFQLLRAI